MLIYRHLYVAIYCEITEKLSSVSRMTLKTACRLAFVVGSLGVARMLLYFLRSLIVCANSSALQLFPPQKWSDAYCVKKLESEQ